jgi:hypothetical protein
VVSTLIAKLIVSTMGRADLNLPFRDLAHNRWSVYYVKNFLICWTAMIKNVLLTVKCWTLPKLVSRIHCSIVQSGSSFENSIFDVCSSDTKIRSEVISPFRSLRMFFYLAFIASGTIGTLITLTRFAAALNGAPNAQPIPDIFKDLGIDLAAVAIFALLYRSDAKAQEASYAKLSREEILSTLRVELANKRVVTLQQLRGISRIVIISGSREYIQEAFIKGEPFKEALLERGVLVVPYSLDGPLSSSEIIASTGKQSEGSVAVQEQPTVTATQKWIATPIYTNEWSRYVTSKPA